MEESLNLHILNTFGITQKDIRTYSPLALAYIGDGVYDLVIRTAVVGEGNTSPNKLHQHTSHIVKAAAQAKLIEAIHDDLTEEEQDVFRRGRNAKSFTMAKNATVRDYRYATGFEALIGWLYLNGDLDRILYLVKLGIEKCGYNL